MGQASGNAPAETGGVKIRNFRAGEEGLLGMIYSDALRRLEVSCDFPGELEMLAPDGFSRIKWRERICAGRPFVAEMDGDVAGFATLGQSGRIEDFYVRPVFTGKGGDSLMAHVEIIARRQKLPELYANACLMAESFFHRQGFYTVKRGNRFFNGLRIAGAHVRKRLFYEGF